MGIPPSTIHALVLLIVHQRTNFPRMDFETFDLITRCSILSALVPLPGLIKFKSYSRELKLLMSLVIISFLCDIGSIYLKPVFNINTNYASSGYQLAEFIILFVIYYHALHYQRRLNVFAGLGLIFLLLFFTNLLFIQQEGINTYTKLYAAFVFILLSIGYFYQLMKDLPTLHLQRLPMFWINTAVLVYFSGNFFLFLMSDYLVKVLHEDLMIYWSFHNFLNITKNLLFASAVWQGYRALATNS
jgi:hypothetical protein